MKRVLSITGILGLAILFTSAISIREIPQDPPRGKKGKKHIKVVKVEDDGKKVKIDTVVEADEVFVWNGDTLGRDKDLGELMEKIQDMDMDFDFDFDFDMDVEADEDGNVFVFKGKKDAKPFVYEFKTEDGDSIRKQIKIIANGVSKDIVKWHNKGDNDFIFGAPHKAHGAHIIRIDKDSRNVIDLSGPGVISFEKKDLKDGKEKIVIIREKPSEEELEMHEEIIMHGDHPRKVKEIKVIAGDEGHVKIFDDGELWSVDEMEEGEKIIEKDGKKIIIKKMKKGNEVKVDVEVEEEIHEEE